MQKYVVVEDRQGGEFGMGRCYTAEEWLEQMLEWRDSDDSWGDYGDGEEYLDTRGGCEKFWKKKIADGKEQELIDYIAEIWQLEFDTKESVVADLQDRVSKNDILTIDKLSEECDRYGLEPFEDILSPMEWNSCDRCGSLWETDYLCWTEGLEEEDELIDIVDKAWERGEDWSALCEDCVEELVDNEEEIMDRAEYLEYLKRKAEVCPLDKEELYELEQGE